jgi:hypothetical protein
MRALFLVVQVILLSRVAEIMSEFAKPNTLNDETHGIPGTCRFLGMWPRGQLASLSGKNYSIR